MLMDHHSAPGIPKNQGTDVMVVALDGPAAGLARGPLADFVKVDADAVTVEGDATGARKIYVHVDEDRLLVSNRADSLLRVLRAAGTKMKVSELAISSMLQNGVISPGQSAIDPIRTLFVCEKLTVRRRAGGIQSEMRYEFPFFNSQSRGTSRPSTEHLLNLLTASLERQLENFSEPVLMLSAGKDSTPIALALAELGRKDVRCITYSDGLNEEQTLAGQICAQLGLPHRTVELETSPQTAQRQFIQLLERSIFPSADTAFIPYGFCLLEAGRGADLVLDGSGNDIFVGNLLSRKHWAKFALASGDRRGIARLGSLIPHDSIFKHVLATKVTAFFPGYYLGPNQVRRLFSASVDMRDHWIAIANSAGQRDIYDFYNFVNPIIDANIALKAEEAARSIGAAIAFPWADEALAHYYYHLPEASRFDSRTGKNKILIRQMLREHLANDDILTGKRWFGFQTVEFLRANRAWIEPEIRSCSLWSAEGLADVGRWYDEIERRPRLGTALMTILQISGWFNHSPYAPS